VFFDQKLIYRYQTVQDTKSKDFAANLITNYLPQVLFPVVYFGHKFWKKTKVVGVHEMDFVSGVDEITAEETEEDVPKTWWRKALAWVF